MMRSFPWLAALGLWILAPLAGALAQPTEGPEEPAKLGIIAIKPGPEWVKARLEEKNRLIAVEPRVEGLPQRLSYELRTDWPDFAVLPGHSIDPDLRRWSEAQDQASPTACVADLTGDGLEDAAAFVIDKSSGELRTLAFHQVRRMNNGIEDHGYRLVDILPPRPLPGDEQLAGLTLLCQPPGDYAAFDEPVTLRLGAHSLVIGWQLFYYLEGEYRSIYIAD